MALQTLTLDSGVILSVTQFFQMETFDGGVIIGNRSADRNLRTLEMLKRTGKHYWSSVPIHLIQPDVVIHDSGEEDFLPRVTCFAHLRSSDPVHDTEMDGSHVVLLYLQENILPHISQRNLEKICHLDWAKVAADFGY